jgi:hypothetical protein
MIATQTTIKEIFINDKSKWGDIMNNYDLKDPQIMNLTNKTNQDKRIGQMREILKDHIDKYKQIGMSEEDIDEYLKLYL